MFLDRLDRVQQEAFLNLARDLTSSDNVSTLGEIAHLNALRREMGIGAEEATAVMSVDAAAECFSDRRSRTIVLLELIQLAHSDRSYSTLESRLIRRLCALWEIKREGLREIEAWVVRYRALMDEARRLLSDP